jgi:predicted ArsR family transcriptional regulator
MTQKSQQQMAATGVLGETRGRLLSELCGRPKTAVELADMVGTSSNAVRVHLGSLRAAGLVDFKVERRGVGKPTHVFSLTAAAEYLLSSAYAPALRALLETLRHKLDRGFPEMVREAGVTLAHQQSPTTGEPGIELAMEVFRGLGGLTSAERNGSDYILRSACCPLGAVTKHTPEACKLFEAMLATVTGLPVSEHCERGERPRCAFTIGTRGDTVLAVAATPVT